MGITLDGITKRKTDKKKMSDDRKEKKRENEKERNYGKEYRKKREGLGVWNKRWKGSEGEDKVGKYKAKKRE